MPDRLTVHCSDGITRTGTVIYIHPLRIFAVIQFEFFRESFFLHRPDHECQFIDNYESETFCQAYARKDDAVSKAKPRHGFHRRRFTSEEDRAVIESKNLYQTGKKLHRTEGTISQRRTVLRRRMQNAKQA